MNTTLLFVGKTTDAHIEALCQDYLKRLTHYLPVKVQVIPEPRNTKALTPEQQKQAEGEMILRAVSPSTDLILLDEHGTEYRSVEFAQVMQKKMSAGRDILLVIGGPYGFSQAVYDRANGKISLSQMTFSHQMVRLFLIEQIYRAMTILRGEPYHHEQKVSIYLLRAERESYIKQQLKRTAKRSFELWAMGDGLGLV